MNYTQSYLHPRNRDAVQERLIDMINRLKIDNIRLRALIKTSVDLRKISQWTATVFQQQRDISTMQSMLDEVQNARNGVLKNFARQDFVRIDQEKFIIIKHKAESICEMMHSKYFGDKTQTFQYEKLSRSYGSMLSNHLNLEFNKVNQLFQ